MWEDNVIPFRVFSNLVRKEWNNWNDVPVHMKKNIKRTHRNLGHPSVQQMEKLFHEAKVSDEATEALKHFSCNRLMQPPARRQLAVAHDKMFNDVVSMDVNFWNLKERHSREKKR